MIIVSQDKNLFINFNNIIGIEIYPQIDDTQKFEINAEKINGELYEIGFYETEERAKEVLQKIIRAYEKAGNIMFETDEDEKLLKLTHNSNVFEMPEK